jgi:hypothetical protein
MLEDITWILDEFQCIKIYLLIQISTMYHCNISCNFEKYHQKYVLPIVSLHTKSLKFLIIHDTNKMVPKFQLNFEIWMVGKMLCNFKMCLFENCLFEFCLLKSECVYQKSHKLWLIPKDSSKHFGKQHSCQNKYYNTGKIWQPFRTIFHYIQIFFYMYIFYYEQSFFPTMNRQAKKLFFLQKAYLFIKMPIKKEK